MGGENAIGGNLMQEQKGTIISIIGPVVDVKFPHWTITKCL